jgi:hypothetical protein
VLNYIRPLVDMILSMEKDRKIEFRVVGREPSDDSIADLLTALVKQISDESDVDFFTSDTFREMIIGGRGCMYVEPIEVEGQKCRKIETGYIPWEDVYLDPHYRKPDASDARYIMHTVWMDRDIAKEQWGEKVDKINDLTEQSLFDDFEGIENSAQKNSNNRLNYFDSKTDRVLIVECQYKDSKGKIHYVVFSGEVFLEGSEDGENPAPFETNGYWIIPVTAFRDKNGLPKGVVELIRNMQDMLNKENSKLIWNMMSNRLFIENDATNDINQLRTEWNRPDGVILLNEGGLGKVKSQDNLNESQHLMSHMQFLLNMMQRVSGINDSMLGFGGVNERSAQQQSIRITQGASVQSELLQNMLFARKMHCRRMIYYIGKYYTDAKMVRITQANGINVYLPMNQKTQNEQGEFVLSNQIDDILKYDIIFKAESVFNSTRQFMMQTFSDIAKSGVFPPLLVAELMLQLSDIPNKQDLLLKFQQYIGMQQQQEQAMQQAGVQTSQ